ncbi:MAG: type II secretion system major pseudopilin GspG [Planctomycetes bacterium]|nr:type II secretion system major pseudopilin GspG [Planctomycetota bacterium]MCC6407254.1 type II secretion system major pseudopilin GspG [Planctomycetota bacterium]
MKTLQSHRRAPRAGFSLAELMVVIVILGLLATLVVPNVVGYLFKANTEIVKVDISSLVDAIKQFQINNGGKLPDSLDQLIEPDPNGHRYLDTKSLPRDPWKNEYQYETNGSEYRIYSYGKDGMPGGEGEDADIDSDTIKERK